MCPPCLILDGLITTFNKRLVIIDDDYKTLTITKEELDLLTVQKIDIKELLNINDSVELLILVERTAPIEFFHIKEIISESEQFDPQFDNILGEGFYGIRIGLTDKLDDMDDFIYSEYSTCTRIKLETYSTAEPYLECVTPGFYFGFILTKKSDSSRELIQTYLCNCKSFYKVISKF